MTADDAHGGAAVDGVAMDDAVWEGWMRWPVVVVTISATGVSLQRESRRGWLRKWVWLVGGGGCDLNLLW
ncbi:hypothetical protein SESBI_25009 [Sesbania bispinosa]|nr:hypothetical protein SESBI_25009 [Sesbania bispinosa]